MKNFITRKVFEKMIKSGDYIIIRSGNDLNGLMDKKTNKIYRPKIKLYIGGI